jgi:hypothetical protein
MSDPSARPQMKASVRKGSIASVEPRGPNVTVQGTN